MSRILEWRGDGLQIAICCVIVVLISWMMTKIFRHKKHGIQIGDPHKGHRWFLTDFLDKPTYCNECEAPVVRGGFCENCGVCVHEECIPNAFKRLACKVLVLSKNSVMKHHWVKGNLPLCSVCSICGFHCGTEPRLCDFRCVWCKDKVHEGCVKRKTTTCDLGRYGRMILPPNCISLTIEGWTRGRKRYVVKDVCRPTLKHWSPVLVFANRKSGDNEGERLISVFRGLLNPVQVCERRLCNISKMNASVSSPIAIPNTEKTLNAEGRSTEGFIVFEVFGMGNDRNTMHKFLKWLLK